jgi:hypothetical protein
VKKKNKRMTYVLIRAKNYGQKGSLKNPKEVEEGKDG